MSPPRTRAASGARWSYEQAVGYLLSHVNYEAVTAARLPPRTPGDLKRFARGLARLGNPEKQAPAIHIGGTNGKGSTAALTSALLSSLGRKTGLYTSPHLVDMRERIRVGGVPVARTEFSRAAQVASEFVGGGEGGSGFRTTFELLTAMAFLVFCSREVDAQVIEVGLGGRLDSTNVILPRVAVITSISLDHAEVLGNDLATIAADKAHILKRGVRAVTARQLPPARRALEARARKVGLVLETTDDMTWTEPGATPRGEAFDLTTPAGHYENLVLGLRGLHQVENAALAVRAVELFTGGALPLEVVRRALFSARWPGRFQVLAGRPPLVVDGAHNPGGAACLVGTLSRYFPSRPVCLVVGASKGKDVEAILAALAPAAGAVIAVGAGHPRAEDPEVVAAAARRYAGGVVETARDLKTGLIRARHLARGGVVCVAGSLYLVGDTLRIWPDLKASWSGAAPPLRRSRPRRLAPEPA